MSARDAHGQYLHVTIDVPTGDVSDFKKYMKGLIPTFSGPVPVRGEIAGFGWVLRAAMAREQKGTTRFLHLWQMRDPRRPLLWEAMAQLGTLDDYGALDRARIASIPMLWDQFKPTRPMIDRNLGASRRGS